MSLMVLSLLWFDFTSNLVHGLAFGTSKFYIGPHDKIDRELVNLIYNWDVKWNLSLMQQHLVQGKKHTAVTRKTVT